MKLRFTSPISNFLRLAFRSKFELLFILLLAGCMQQEEFPNKDAATYDPASENIKNWFEANKEVLISRNQQGSENFRSENSFLFPYIEKEVDWTQHKTYKFKDGREVTEFPVLSEKIPIPGFLVDSVGDKSKIKIKQSVLFVKKLEGTDYSPLLVRFYSLQENIDQVSYSHIPKDWNGIIEAFGMNDGHYITFSFKEGQMVSYSKVLLEDTKAKKQISENKSTTCITSIVENPSYVVCHDSDVSPYDCTIYSASTSIITYCIDTGNSGSGGSGPGGDSFCEEFDCYAFPGTEGLGDGLEEEDQIIKDLSFKGTTADCIYEKLLSINGFKELASEFDGLGTEFDVELKIGATQNASANGQTWWRGPNQPIEITFNEANINRSALEVARTIVHEMVHAEMYRAINTTNPSEVELDFRETFNAYVMMYKGSADQQHNLMADEWVTKMGEILKDVHQILDPNGYNSFKNYYYPNGIPDHFYKSVAWEGLTDTIAWNLMKNITTTPPIKSPLEIIEQDLRNARSGLGNCINN